MAYVIQPKTVCKKQTENCPLVISVSFSPLSRHLTTIHFSSDFLCSELNLLNGSAILKCQSTSKQVSNDGVEIPTDCRYEPEIKG